MNKLYVLGLGSVVVVAALAFALLGGNDEDEAEQLEVYCAAGMRYAMEDIAEEYEKEYGVKIQLDYAGSGALLSKIQENPSGDLYLAADASYIEEARQKNLAAESIPIARMRPVIAVAKGNPKGIASIDDLLNPDISVVVGDPSAAIGKKTKKLLTVSGHWDKLYENVKSNGVTKPTVNDVANAVKMESIDAGIIWDSTVAQYPDLQTIRVPELDAGTSNVEICVLESTKVPTDALRFARYVAASDRGLKTFKRAKFETVDGDKWQKTPEITLFAGAVNEQALEPIVKEFEKREGVKINTKYDGCGILTGQMRDILDTGEKGFPDAFMACDIYYLREVQDLFDRGTNVSDTDIVMVVQKNNPKGINSLADLTKEDVRVAIGEPNQCTIGILTKKLLDDAGLYDDDFLENVVMQAPSSALLVPQVTELAADVALAYRTDTLGERSRIEVIEINSPLSKAIQPYSVALSSEHKHLMDRLLEKIRNSRSEFETAGFNWRLDGQTTVAKPTVDKPQPLPKQPTKSAPATKNSKTPSEAPGVESG
jgi:molybdate transport system substrate-binding protein